MIDAASDDELSFRGSIFQTILNDKRELKDKDALLHDDNDPMGNDSGTNVNQNSPLGVSNYSGLQHLNERLRSNSGDSWDKFNALLLKFLNNYMKQVKLTEEQRNLYDDMQSRDKRQSRRTSSSSIHSRSDQGESNVPKVSPGNQNDINYNIMMNSLPGEKNLLTFACLAQDGNPMNNLTFDWTFNSMSLPESEQAKSAPAFNAHTDNDLIDNLDNLLAPNTETRPVLIYSNENSTLSIQLIRRLDTRTTLNPFQLSLLTLNVIVNNDQQKQDQANNQRPTRQTNHKNIGPQLRAPVVKNRYQSFYNNLKSSSNPTDNGGVHIAHEFDSIKLPANLELNQDNWQQQLGLLLKCTVSNQIGTSESCPATINLQERLARSGAQTGSSLYEFAKWRMPSLAQKSLLIISLMVSCMLILFATFALLIGPYLKSLQLAGLGKRQDGGAGGGQCLKDDGTNTGQSTSSQKSSVLGLLGNGDSSLQTSSDDDCSGRSNNHHHMDLTRVNNNQQPQGIANDSYDDRMNGAIMNRLGAIDYDRPRSGRLIYQPGNLNEQLSSSSSMSAAYPSGHYLQGNNNLSTESGQPVDSLAKGSAGGRLLASLRFKSLSTKFKVDRIADLPSITGRLGGAGVQNQQQSLHTKNMSNSETTTTGLSINGLDTAGQTLASTATNATNHLRSSSHFGAPNLRHSHHFGRPTGRPGDHYMYRDAYGHQLNHDHQTNHLNSSSMYSNMMPTINGEPMNAMDEFLRRRGLTTSTPAPVPAPYDYDSQSLSRNQAAISYSLQQNQYKPRAKPPVHPRTMASSSSRANSSSTMYRPTEVARTSIPQPLHHHNYQQQLFSPSTLGRAALAQVGPQYAFTKTGFQSYGNDPMNPAPTNRLDTIDSHLDRLPVDSLALGLYTNQMMNNDHGISHHQHQLPPSSDHQMAYANTLEIGSNTYNPNLYNHAQVMASGQNHQSAEHIYDVNAYATPEQTPLRRPNSIHNGQQDPTLPESERPRVSQLIQSFNSQLSD